MTHGDKAKAGKAASQASGNKKSSSKADASGKAGAAEKELKGAKTSAKGIQAGAKRQAAGEKAAAAPQTAAKADAKSGSDKASIVAAAKIKARPAVPDASGFTNPVISNAFKRALKKFPNAFRRLTD